MHSQEKTYFIAKMYLIWLYFWGVLCLYFMSILFSFSPFFLLSFVFLWYQGNTHPIKWVKNCSLCLLFLGRDGLERELGQSYSLLFDETLHFSSHSLESYYFERSLIMSLISLIVFILFRLHISSWWDLAGFDLQEIVSTHLSCQIYIVELLQPDNGHC